MNMQKTKPAAPSVAFSTEARIHIGIGVANIKEAIAFYELLFEQKPSKMKDNYARFEVEHSPVNLALNQIKEPMVRDSVSHFGIQVKEQKEIAAATSRFEQAGYTTSVEESVSCCYAIQDRVWVTDPDGNRWEIFLVLDDSEQYSPGGGGECCVTEGGEDCCSPVEKSEGCCS